MASFITALKTADSGKLCIGDNWNAIRIIALSQSNPLKAVAEFVESIELSLYSEENLK